MKIYLPILLGVSLLSACSMPQQVYQDSATEFINLTSDYIQQCTKVSGMNDPLEETLIFNTRDCFQMKNGILKVVWDDQFVRAYVSKTDKRTTSIQVYNVMYTRQNRWIYPRSANFLVDGELKIVDGVSISSDVDCAFSDTYGSCLYTNHYAFDLPKDIFSEAKRLKSVGETQFLYRIKTKAGGDFDRVLNVEEIIGLELKMKAVFSGL